MRIVKYKKIEEKLKLASHFRFLKPAISTAHFGLAVKNKVAKSIALT